MVGDPKLIQELNRRLTRDPTYKLPDGYTKVVEKEVINSYVIPAYFPVSESKRIAIEVLDDLFASMLGIHFLEPMSYVKEVARAKPNLKEQAKDKIMHEIHSTTLDLKAKFSP